MSKRAIFSAKAVDRAAKPLTATTEREQVALSLDDDRIAVSA